MTREFFTPDRKRWIAPSIRFRERVDVAIEFLELYEATVLSCRIRSLENRKPGPLSLTTSPSLGDLPGAQSHWIARAIAMSAHCASRRPTVPVMSNAAF